MAKQPTAGSVDEYIAQFPPPTRKVLAELRALVRGVAPGVTERISYAIPTFDLNGHYLVYIAGWRDHVALYPVTAGVVEAIEAEIAPYRSGKGTLRFPLGKPMPVELIGKIVAIRVAEVGGANLADGL